MDTVRVIHDREGETLTLWFGDPATEASSVANDSGVVTMKDSTGRVIGVEILGFKGRPSRAALEIGKTKARI